MSGELVTPEQARDYKLSKGPRGEIGMLLMTEEPEGKKFTLRSLGGDIIEALGFKKADPVVDPQKSKAVARSKARGRLFENVDLGASMTELDEQLRKEK
jgi:hypothetical protein